MKPATIIKLIVPVALAAMTGCASSAPAPATPKNTAKMTQADDDFVVLPAQDLAAPGSMEMSWEPPPPPPQKKVRAKKAIQPYKEAKKRRLFVIPTTFSAGE